MFEKLGKILPSKLERPGVSGQIRAAMIVDASQKVLDEMFDEWRGECKIKTFKEGKLHIVCTSSVYAQEIRLYEEDIMSAINNSLGKRLITSIRPTG